MLRQAVGGEPPRLRQAAARSGALQEFAPLQGNTVVGRPEVRRSGPGASGSARDSVGEAQIPQSQTLVAWRGGRGSSVTLILGGGGDTVHWMQAGVKGKEGMEMEGGGGVSERWGGGIKGGTKENNGVKSMGLLRENKDEHAANQADAVRGAAAAHADTTAARI